MERAVHEALSRMRGVERMDIARSMIDPAVLYILAACSRRCLTISEISPMVNLPPATCYKMVYQLESMGLVAFCGTGRSGGRGKASVYTSVLKEMHLEIKGTVIHLSVTWKNGTADEYHRDMSPIEPTGMRSVVPRASSVPEDVTTSD